MRQHTIDFVGTVDHSICSMCVPDQIHTILFTVEGPLGSVINHIIIRQEVIKQKVYAFYVSVTTDDQLYLPCLFEKILVNYI